MSLRMTVLVRPMGDRFEVICQRGGVDLSHTHVELADMEAAVLGCARAHQLPGEVLEVSIDGEVVGVAATAAFAAKLAGQRVSAPPPPRGRGGRR